MEAVAKPVKKPKRQFKNPNSYFLIMIVIFAAALATSIVPAGQYDRYIDEATGRGACRSGIF